MHVRLILCCLTFGRAYGSEEENLVSPQTIPMSSTASVKIMQLGGSITASTQGQNSFRFYLWQLVIAKGYRIDFVGSQHGCQAARNERQRPPPFCIREENGLYVGHIKECKPSIALVSSSSIQASGFLLASL